MGRMLGGGDEGARTPVPPRRVQLRPSVAGAALAQAVGADGATGFRCDALAALGLAIDADTGVISGTPPSPGEHRLRVTASNGTAPIELDVELIVTPDPRSLWREVEPPADAPHTKPHAETLRLAGDCLIVGASKRGRSHAHAGGFREDHFGARIVGPWHLLAIADGAGSAALSRLGSQVAVEAALDTLAGLPAVVGGDPGEMVAEHLVAAVRAAAQALDDLAVADSTDRRALATTLIVAVVARLASPLPLGGGAGGGAVPRKTPAAELPHPNPSPEGEGLFLFSALGIGDGGAGVVDGDALHLLTKPDGGEFAGQTRFLEGGVTDSELAARVRGIVRSDFAALMLMTDGITDPHLPTDTAFADYGAWAALLADVQATAPLTRDNPAAADQLLGWLDFWSRGNHDDRTLLVLVP